MSGSQINGALEDNLLTLLCFSAECAAEISLRVPLSLWSTRYYRWIAEHAANYLERYSRPAGTHIRDLLEDRIKKGDEGKLILRAIDEMERLYPELQAQYVLERLDFFLEKRKLTQSIEEAIASLDKDDLTKAKEALFANPPTPAGSSGIWMHEPEQALRFLEVNEEDFFSSAIDALDKRGVRPARKTMMLLIGKKKSGKSWWLINVGKSNILYRKRVLHITLEMPEEQVAGRYLQSLFALAMSEDDVVSMKIPRFRLSDVGGFEGIDYEELIAKSLTKLPKKVIRDRIETLRSRPYIFVKEFPTGTFTIGQYRALLDSLEKRHRFVPDLVLLDYPDLMDISADSQRIDTGRTYRNLRGVAMQRNHALVTVTQANRKGEDAKLLRSKDIGEDYTKVQTADTILTYSQTRAEKERGLARVFVEAARTVADEYITLVSQSYGTGQFALDSVVMGSKVREALQLATGEGKE